MLRERRLWLIIRNLERETNKPAVPRKLVFEKALRSGFLDYDDVIRVFESLVKQGKAEYLLMTVGVGNEKCLKTDPTGDNYFAHRYFWPKVADAIGFWKILSAIGVLVGLWPGGVVSQIIVIVFNGQGN
jgi:hypothetical protein